jgi:predicted nucleic acid-binding protein
VIVLDTHAWIRWRADPARQAGARLVTRDSRIAQFDPARVAW